MRRRHFLAAATGIGLLRTRAALAGPRDWLDAEVNGMHYKVLPPDAAAPPPHPVVLYLHQLDMGDWPDGLLQQVNPWFNTAAFRSRHPCIVVMPLLDQKKDPAGHTINFGGDRHGHVGEDNAMAALRQVMAANPVDPRRIYITGNSLGGMGTWAMLLAYNRLTGRQGRIFAAGMPLAGTDRSANPVQAARTLRHVPVWAFHGAHDTKVSPAWDRHMARLLSGARTFRYTEYGDLGHEIWDRTYTRHDVWSWLFAQRGPA
ncbi:MAG: hypothetical protein B7Z80_19070 [Rhodospirillales bacterium 20-64-7]|nr:MAG: hypothetical protein B7Z80_19070 [Rhodospirillales bacterium 20-64-7]HQT76524.1 hypothetical protein [Rhodopila sp.]